MPREWFQAALDEVTEAAERLHAALDATVASLADARRDCAAGLPLVEIVDRLRAQGGPARRLEAGAAIDAYEHAVMEFRARTVRSLVDEHGLTLKAVADRLGISRQMVTRLYRSADPASEPSDG